MFPRHVTWIVGSLSVALAGACSSTPQPDGASSGGAVGVGGTASGGAAVSGGAPGVGGTGPGTGGAAATGGAGVTGGGPGSGGAVGSGGATGSGGGSTGGSGTGGSGAVGQGPSDLPPAPGEANVPKPSGTPGDVTVLNWAGFEAAVTFSFDDNDGSQLAAYDTMHAMGGRYTYYLVSDWGITDAKWKTIHADGNEIGNHTTNHSCGTSQIQGARTAIEGEFQEAPTTVAAPNGDDGCQSAATGFAFINREVGPASPVTPLSNVNPFAMNCYIPGTGQMASAYEADLNNALNQNGWVIYVIHGINGVNGMNTQHDFQPVSWEGLQGGIQHAIDSDIWVDTMENIGAYWLGQKQFAAAMSQTAGDSTTWTWTLPNNFPEGKYLRVTVDGGTLSQGGTPLVWDPHGYYEVALDDLSVTLGP